MRLTRSFGALDGGLDGGLMYPHTKRRVCYRSTRVTKFRQLGSLAGPLRETSLVMVSKVFAPAPVCCSNKSRVGQAERSAENDMGQRNGPIKKGVGCWRFWALAFKRFSRSYDGHGGRDLPVRTPHLDILGVSGYLP